MYKLYKYIYFFNFVSNYSGSCKFYVLCTFVKVRDLQPSKQPSTFRFYIFVFSLLMTVIINRNVWLVLFVL